MLRPEWRRELRPGNDPEMDPESRILLATNMKSHVESLRDYVYPALTKALTVARSTQDERINHDTWLYLKVVLRIASDVGYDCTRPSFSWYATPI
jgi:hypothetical protein